jgi:hypothetical protein
MNDVSKLLAITAGILIMASFFSFLFQNPDEKYIKQNDCKVVSTQESDETIYCGKACWQKANLVTYHCASDNSRRSILEVRK